MRAAQAGIDRHRTGHADRGSLRAGHTTEDRGPAGHLHLQARDRQPVRSGQPARGARRHLPGCAARPGDSGEEEGHP